MSARLGAFLCCWFAWAGLAGAQPPAGAGTAAGPAAAVLAPATAIDKAGRQRMLSQRLAKAYLMVWQDVQPERGRTILGESVALFEAQLAELAGFVPSEDVRRALAALKRSWNGFKPVLAAPPTAQSAREVYDLNEAVQEAAHRLTLSYERVTGKPADRLVNIAGRQRMLSQRMAKYFLFKAFDVNAQAARMELDMARAEFSSAMHQLFVASRDDERIKAALGELDREWIAYRAALAAHDDAAALRRAAPQVIESSERILAATERLVALYEKQARTQGR
ncbi:MAG: type IV pili methyl-accepting chemotaxis transducer N-terminal domain-containing protein [Burkholderiales bacterium]|nr:type IV pili methyl-accepting chemotaxis transducer N-terminal domain-containing protein [Burkholderiales bacterium]